MDQRSGTGWQALGSYSFSAETVYQITMQATTPGFAVADALLLELQ